MFFSNKELKETNRLLREILTILVSRTTNIKIDWNNTNMSDATVQISPTAKAIATPVELAATGQPFPFVPANIQYSVQDPTVASFTVDPTTGIATFIPLAVGMTQVAITDTGTGATNTTSVLTVTAGAQPNTLDISWSVFQ